MTLVTTLVEERAYLLEALADLCGMRWRVELNFRHLKTTMKMDVLKCLSVEGVLKQLTVFAIVYNLVRLMMIEASARRGVAVDRISFVDALRYVGRSKPNRETTCPSWS